MSVLIIHKQATASTAVEIEIEVETETETETEIEVGEEVAMAVMEAGARAAGRAGAKEKVVVAEGVARTDTWASFPTVPSCYEGKEWTTTPSCKWCGPVRPS